MNIEVERESFIAILQCVREQQLTEEEIEKEFRKLYPPLFSKSRIRKRRFDVPEAIRRAVENKLLGTEYVKRGGRTATFFFITPLGRGLITLKPKE